METIINVVLRAGLWPSEMCAYKNRLREQSALSPLTLRKGYMSTKGEDGCLYVRRVLAWTWSGCHSDLGNPASKTMRNEFLFFINYPGYFVIAPWRDWQLGTQMASKNGSYYYFNFTRNLRSSNGLPWWLSDKEFTCPYRRRGFNLRVSEIAPREGNDNLLQYSCWEIPWTEESGGLQSMGSQK